MSVLRIVRPARAAAVLCAVLIAALLLAVLGAGPARAADLSGMPDGPTALVLHAFEQPEVPGQPATGLPLGHDVTDGLTPVGGVEFRVRAVPGIDLHTDAGWARARALSLVEAAALVADQPVAGSGATAADGSLMIDGLGVALYYVEAVSAPAGIVPGDPFLVPLPLPNPVEAGAWLTTVHVYPKNAPVGVVLAVDDESAVAAGDRVTWTSRTAIPHQVAISGYRVQNLHASGVVREGSLADIRVTIAGGPVLEPGADFTLAEIEVDGQQGFETVFTATGLTKLAAARAADPAAAVVIGYDTHVTGSGVFTDRVRLLAGSAAAVEDTATTKFGPVEIVVRERGNPQHLIPGARFRLYLSPEDALAGRAPVTVDGRDEWTTDAQGTILIDGLRFSGFVNGLEREPGDPLFRWYYVMLTHIPAGYTGIAEPLGLTVDSSVEAHVALVELWRGGGELPVTGAQLTGMGLLGGVLAGGGVLLALRRRARREETATP